MCKPHKDERVGAEEKTSVARVLRADPERDEYIDYAAEDTPDED
jgi:hypothetical protein